MRTPLIIAAGFVFIALAAAWSMIPLMTSYAPPEPTIDQKLVRCAILMPVVVVVVAAVAALTRVRSRVLIPLFGLASIWPWVALVIFLLIVDGPHRGSDFLVTLPIPAGFLLAWLGLTIGHGIAARLRPRPEALTAPSDSPPLP